MRSERDVSVRNAVLCFIIISTITVSWVTTHVQDVILNARRYGTMQRMCRWGISCRLL